MDAEHKLAVLHHWKEWRHHTPKYGILLLCSLLSLSH